MTALYNTTVNLGTPAPLPNATVMSLYKYAPPTKSANTPAAAPVPQLSMLGSTNGGKLAGPSQPVHGPAIPMPLEKRAVFG